MKLLIPKQEAYHKQYYIDHKEVILANTKKYNATHEDEGKTYRKNRYEAKKEQLLAEMKVRRAAEKKKLEKQKMIKFIQDINKIYDEDYQMTYKKLAEMFGVSSAKIGKYIWNPRKRSRHIEPAVFKKETKRCVEI